MTNGNRTTPIVAGRVRQSAHVVSVIDHDDTVLMDIVQGAYYSLDAVGGRIWQLLNEPATVAELASQLCSEYDIPEEAVTADLWRLLRELGDAQLIARE